MSCYKFGLQRKGLLNVSYREFQFCLFSTLQFQWERMKIEGEKTLGAKCSNISYEELIIINIKIYVLGKKQHDIQIIFIKNLTSVLIKASFLTPNFLVLFVFKKRVKVHMN